MPIWLLKLALRGVRWLTNWYPETAQRWFYRLLSLCPEYERFVFASRKQQCFRSLEALSTHGPVQIVIALAVLVYTERDSVPRKYWTYLSYQELVQGFARHTAVTREQAGAMADLYAQTIAALQEFGGEQGPAFRKIEKSPVYALLG